MSGEFIASPFQFPITVEVLPEGERLADEFCAMAKGIRSKDTQGGLLGHSWGQSLTATGPEDYDKSGYTSAYNHNLAEQEQFDELHKVTVKQIEKYLRVVGVKNMQFGLTNSWASIYGEGHFVPEHTHPMAHLSVVFYAAATEGTGEIIFNNPAYSSYAMTYGGGAGGSLFNDKFPVSPKKGMMIVFPSFIPHGTRPHEDTEERVIFSVNAKFNL